MASRPPLDDAVFVEGLLSGVAELLRVPTEEIPSVRCVARPSLVRLLGKIRDRLAIPGHRRVSATNLLKLLVRGGLARPVPLADLKAGLPSDRLYAVGLGGDPSQLDPVELLQAHAPRGVVCYFTALGVHGLTTQLPSHHHVAHLAPARTTSPISITARDEEGQVDDTVSDLSKTAVKRLAGLDALEPGTTHSLGTREFTYEGLAYYSTHREAHRVAGVQRRYLNERTRFRLTSLEQTLLDTLHRPHSCGGPPVVYEAWETGAGRLNPERLAKLLERIGDPRLARRTGYMLDQYGDVSSPALANVLSRAWPVSASAGSLSEDSIVPLLPGVPPTSVDPRWGVAVP